MSRLVRTVAAAVVGWICTAATRPMLDYGTPEMDQR